MTTRTIAGAAAVALLAACGGSSDEAAGSNDAAPNTAVIDSTSSSTTSSSTTSSTSTSSTTTAAPEPDPIESLAGRWAHFDVVAYEDGVLKTLIISYGFNDFTVSADGELIDQASFCFSEQRTDQPISTSLSDAATQAIQPPPVAMGVEVMDGVVQLMRPPTPTPVGIRLDDPVTESLPTDRNDERIVDDDGDGNPGITVDIEVSEDLRGQLYIARREIFSYTAEQVTPDRIEGVVVDDSEQLVVGASDPIFDQGDANWVQLADPARNPIILERVDDTWDCERLRAEREALFPPTPDVDW